MIKHALTCPRCFYSSLHNIQSLKCVYRCENPECKKDFEVVMRLTAIHVVPYEQKLAKPSQFLSQFD